MSIFDNFEEWSQRRIEERRTKLKADHFTSLDPNVPRIDAGPFTTPLAELARTMSLKVEREGPARLRNPNVTTDIGVILRQMTWTFGLLCWINADDTRTGVIGYKEAYSFVSLPLVRTLIDGFYNSTALLDDPSRSRAFRISGFFRLRQALREDEARYSNDPAWKADLDNRRKRLDFGLSQENLTDADLDDKKNKWPLLGDYVDLKKNTDTSHRQLIRRISLGIWREYSSISHASYDGLVALFPFIAYVNLPHGMRNDSLESYALRNFTMHFGRAAGLLLCLVTEIQHYFKFADSNIDTRLCDIWAAILPMYEIRELYESRYKSILRIQPPDADSQSKPAP